MPTNDTQKNSPKFDSRARNALSIAQQVSMQIGHNFIGSEHLLFGILSQPQDGLPFQVTFIDNFSSTTVSQPFNFKSNSSELTSFLDVAPGLSTTIFR